MINRTLKTTRLIHIRYRRNFSKSNHRSRRNTSNMPFTLLLNNRLGTTRSTRNKRTFSTTRFWKLYQIPNRKITRLINKIISRINIKNIRKRIIKLTNFRKKTSKPFKSRLFRKLNRTRSNITTSHKLSTLKIINNLIHKWTFLPIQRRISSKLIPNSLFNLMSRILNIRITMMNLILNRTNKIKWTHNRRSIKTSSINLQSKILIKIMKPRFITISLFLAKTKNLSLTSIKQLFFKNLSTKVHSKTIMQRNNRLT